MPHIVDEQRMLCSQTDWNDPIIAITTKRRCWKTTTCVTGPLSVRWATKCWLLISIPKKRQVQEFQKHNQHDVRGLLLGESTFRETCIIGTEAGYELLPSDIQLTEAEVGLIGQPRAQFRLKDVLVEQANSYDFVLIDIRRHYMLTINGQFGDGVIMPVHASSCAEVQAD